MNSDARLALVVTLTVRRGAVSQFREFERHAARIMSRHGGAIERTVVESENDATDVFREIHIVSFPDQSAFAAYRTDEELNKYADLRQAAVVRTEIVTGAPGPDYYRSE